METTRPFRKADLDDLDGLLDLANACAAEAKAVEVPGDAYRTALGQIMKTPSLGEIWILDDGEKRVGYLLIVYGFSPEAGGPMGQVEALYLSPDVRLRGYGTAGLRLAQRRAAASGMTSLRLSFRNLNAPFADACERAGFPKDARVGHLRLLRQ